MSSAISFLFLILMDYFLPSVHVSLPNRSERNYSFNPPNTSRCLNMFSESEISSISLTNSSRKPFSSAPAPPLACPSVPHSKSSRQCCLLSLFSPGSHSSWLGSSKLKWHRRMVSPPVPFRLPFSCNTWMVRVTPNFTHSLSTQL